MTLAANDNASASTARSPALTTYPDGRVVVTFADGSKHGGKRRPGSSTVSLRLIAPLPPGPLGAALAEALASRWDGTRGYVRNKSQGTRTVLAVQRVLGAAVSPEAVDKASLRAIVKDWLADGAAPTTVRVRLSCLSSLGVDVKGCRPKLPRTLKWWLGAADEAKIVASLIGNGGDRERRVAHLIMWTTRTGLRIEESLRLTWADIRKTERWATVSVPGLKTTAAQANLVLAAAAVEVLDAIGCGEPGEPVFGLAYWEAQRVWQLHRRVFKLADPEIATLKALRRSAARTLHGVKGMPLDLVRQYLRHESVNTTLGYPKGRPSSSSLPSREAREFRAAYSTRKRSS